MCKGEVNRTKINHIFMNFELPYLDVTVWLESDMKTAEKMHVNLNFIFVT